MPGGVELGTGYLSIVADTRQMPGQITAGLANAQVSADKSGRGMGSKLATGLGATLKVGAAAAGAGVAAVLGTALTHGMSRVVAIDDAKGKLAGLGHTAEGVQTIMDSALASVKGTAYGLGDAAGIAASAVAAGIKPGEDLTRYLKLTGDAATIAGSSLGEMGSIFNKVQTSGKAYTDNLNQLADRGIPIFQWLQDEYGVTAESLSDMVKEGKVDAETFNKVIQDNIGGAALESGKTLRGSFANMKAALGRAGAAVIEPFLPMMKAGLGKVMEFTDKVTPHLKAGAEKAAAGLTEMGQAFMTSGASIDGPATKMEKFGVKAREVVDGLRGVWSILANGEFQGSEMTFGLAEDSKVVDILFRIREGAQALWEVVKSPSGEKFTEFLDTVRGAGDGASETIGKVESGANTLTDVLKSVGSVAAEGGLALASLGGDTAAVAVTGIKALGNVMGFFADHTGLATTALAGLAAGFAIAQVAETGFHMARVATAIMMPADIASRMAMTAAIKAQTAVMRAHIVALGGEAPIQQLTTRQRIAATIARQREAAATAASTTALMAYANAQRAAAVNSGMFVGGMQRGAAGVATLGAKAQGAASSGLASLRSGLSSMASVVGGPVVLGLAAAAIGIGAFVSASGNLNRKLEENQGAAGKYAKSIVEFRSNLADAFGQSEGRIDSGVKSAVSGQLQVIEQDLDDAAKRMPSKWEGVTAFFKESFSFGQGNQIGDALGLKDAGEDAIKAQAALEHLDLSQRDLATAVTGSSTQWEAFRATLLKSGEGGQILVDKYSQVRAEIIESQSSAGRFKTSLDDINTGAVSAATGVDSLTASMGRLRGDQMTAEDAQQRVNDALRGFSDAAATAGSGVVDASGKINTATSAGSQLYNQMKQVQSAFDQAGATAYQSAIQQGQSQQQAAAVAEQAGLRVRDEFIRQRVESGMALDKAIALANQYGLFPETIPTHIALTGADEAATKLGYIGTLLDNLTKPRTVPTPTPQVTVPSAGEGLGGPSLNFNVPQNADGGTITGPGGPRQDKVLGLDKATRIPTSWVSPGEEVTNAKSASKWRWLLKAVNWDDPWLDKALPKHADGGTVGEALDAVRSVDGNQYLLGGVGPERFDCSGLIGWVQQILMGLGKTTKRIYTTYSITDGQTAGLVRGLSSTSPFNVGVSQEHMAATLAGHAVESGGAHGSSGLDGGRAKAEDAQFPFKYHLPVEMIAGGFDESGAAGSYDGLSSSRTSSATRWTKKDQLALESAKVAVTQAEEARDKVNANEKKSDADRQQAQLRVEKAVEKVERLEAKRNEANQTGTYEPAPDLAGEMDEDSITLRRAEMAITEAELQRDDTYNDPDATQDDKEKADLDVFDARNRLKETQKRILEEGNKKSDKSDNARVKSVKEIGQDLTGILIDGVFDELGLSGSVFADPSRLTEPDTGDTGGYTTRELAKPLKSGGDGAASPSLDKINELKAIPAPMTIGNKDALTQLPFTPGFQTAEETMRLFSGAYDGTGFDTEIPWMNQTIAAAADAKLINDLMQKANPFDRGGRASGVGLLQKDIIAPERVLEPRTTVNFERLTNVLDRGQVLDQLDPSTPPFGGGGGGNTFAPQFHGTDNAEMFRMFEKWFRDIQRGGGQPTRARTSRRR
ncbi:tape measure protein [Rhodococcus sp. USK10]|uniref:tape measure protein n=1 Tax=Rhodococcus sp. USK10 TaxID=2789739 RepID=UPI002150F46C|nr:tape measure protein [Rhodococcus sp. USK10]